MGNAKRVRSHKDSKFHIGRIVLLISWPQPRISANRQCVLPGDRTGNQCAVSEVDHDIAGILPIRKHRNIID